LDIQILNMNKPVFSIVVATKDRPAMIKRFLNNLKLSKITERNDTQVIIVDNNSNPIQADATQKICSEYEVMYLFESKKGQSYAINTGIKNATGRYIVFTDDDIEVKDPEWLDKMQSHFKTYPALGYVSGNVKANNLKTDAQKNWEKKGGLSKGDEPIYFSRGFLSKFKFKPWPLAKICAGANSMVLKNVIDEVGGYSLIFNYGSRIIGHGGSLELGYRIIKAGYELYYDPNAVVFHNHPEDKKDIKRKLFYYAVGDTAINMYFFIKYRDFRSLFRAFGGHQAHVLKNIIRRIKGQYPLPINYLFYSLIGSGIGATVFIWKYFTKKLWKITDAHIQ